MMTRSQKRREQRLPEEKEVAKTQAETNSEKEGKTESGTKLIGDVVVSRETQLKESKGATQMDLSAGTPMDFNFHEYLFEESQPERIKLTKSQKRRQAKQRQTIGVLDEDVNIAQEQQQDKEIQSWKSQEDPDRVLTRNGVLLRRWTPRNQPERVFEQLVHPRVRRRKVLELAHRRPLAGHLGRLKTARRILRNFYWPTLFRDVKEFCEQCPECQLTTRNKIWRAPLISLPIIGEPFERIAMDIVGPLQKLVQDINIFL